MNFLEWIIAAIALLVLLMWAIDKLQTRRARRMWSDEWKRRSNVYRWDRRAK